MDTFPRSVGKNGDENQTTQMAVRLNIELSKTNLCQNVFSYPKQLSEALGRSRAEEEEGVREGDTDQGPKGTDDGKASKKSDSRLLTMSRKRFDPEDEYDLDDDFVDDSDMFFGDVNYVPPKKWDFGFFAWRGRIENFFKEGVDTKDAPIKEPSLAKGRFQSKGKSRRKKGVITPPEEPKAPKKLAINVTNGPRKVSEDRSDPVKPTTKKKRKFADSATPIPGHPSRLKPDDTPSTQNKKITLTPKKSPPPLKKSAQGIKNEIGDSLEDPHSKPPIEVSKDQKAEPQEHTADQVVEPNPAGKTPRGKKVIFYSPDLVAPSEVVCSAAAKIYSIGPDVMFESPILEPEIQFSRHKVGSGLKKLRELCLSEPSCKVENFARLQKKLILTIVKHAIRSGMFDNNLMGTLRHSSDIPPQKLKSLIIDPIAQHLQRMQAQVKSDYLELEVFVKEALVPQVAEFDKKKAEWEHHISVGKEGDEVAPKLAPKFVWSDRTRYLFWKLMNEEWIIAKWYNSLGVLNDMEYRYTESGVRKAIYEKVLRFWPEGWMTADQLFRVYGSIIRRIKEVAALPCRNKAPS